jgi:hypothetical protein
MTGRAHKPCRPCCGVCRMTTLTRPKPDEDIVCESCGAVWDGSEVTRDKLPAILEQAILDGDCSRDDAFAAFLELDELADATVAGDITEEQGLELVERSALRVRGKGKAQ